MAALDKEVLKKVQGIDEAKLFFVLRLLRVRFVSVDTMRAVKIFIALKELGLDVISTITFSYFYGTTSQNALALLHRLGDKGVLTLVKNTKPGAFRYILSEKFVSLWMSTPTSLNT